MDFKDLTPEQQEQARACKSVEEFAELAESFGVQLSDEELADQGISRSRIRLSVGTEHIDDIIADLDAGFAAAANA